MKSTLFERKVTLRQLRMAIRKTLTARQRIVIEAIYFDGKTQASFAKERGIDRSAVCRTQHRAEDRLRRYLSRNTLSKE